MDKTDIFSNTDNFLKSKVYLRVFEENQFRFREWVRVERFPFYGGRDWGQDFLLDHPSVSRQHFVLEKNPVNQTIFLRNLSKTNGMTQQGRSIDYIELKGTTTVMMGGVKIEFLCASHFIDEPTREIDLKELLQREYSLKTVLFMVTQEILLLTFLLGLQHFIQYPTWWNGDYNFFNRWSFFLKWGLGLSFGVSFFSKMHQGEYQFLTFFRITLRILGYYTIFCITDPYVWRILRIVHYDEVMSIIVEFSLLGFLLWEYGKKLFISHQAYSVTKNKRIIYFIFCLLILFFSGYVFLKHNEQTWGEHNFKGTILPPSWIPFSQQFDHWKEGEFTETFDELKNGFKEL